MALKKTVGKFEIKGDNSGLVSVYKNGELQKAVSCQPGQLEEKFNTVCEMVENYINKNKKQ
jgi:hypothetical protein